jgi:hypothetical protein
MAGATGLEPATSCVTGRRSNQLNNAPQNLTVMMTSTTCTALQGLLGLSGASMPFCRDSLARGLENPTGLVHPLVPRYNRLNSSPLNTARVA